jgi:hypothetical protein
MLAIWLDIGLKTGEIAVSILGALAATRSKSAAQAAET